MEQHFSKGIFRLKIIFNRKYWNKDGDILYKNTWVYLTHASKMAIANGTILIFFSYTKNLHKNSEYASVL